MVLERYAEWRSPPGLVDEKKKSAALGILPELLARCCRQPIEGAPQIHRRRRGVDRRARSERHVRPSSDTKRARLASSKSAGMRSDIPWSVSSNTPPRGSRVGSMTTAANPVAAGVVPRRRLFQDQSVYGLSPSRSANARRLTP